MFHQKSSCFYTQIWKSWALIYHGNSSMFDPSSNKIDIFFGKIAYTVRMFRHGDTLLLPHARRIIQRCDRTRRGNSTFPFHFVFRIQSCVLSHRAHISSWSRTRDATLIRGFNHGWNHTIVKTPATLAICGGRSCWRASIRITQGLRRCGLLLLPTMPKWTPTLASSWRRSSLKSFAMVAESIAETCLLRTLQRLMRSMTQLMMSSSWQNLSLGAPRSRQLGQQTALLLCQLAPAQSLLHGEGSGWSKRIDTDRWRNGRFSWSSCCSWGRWRRSRQQSDWNWTTHSCSLRPLELAETHCHTELRTFFSSMNPFCEYYGHLGIKI